VKPEYFIPFNQGAQATGQKGRLKIQQMGGKPTILANIQQGSQPERPNQMHWSVK